MQTLEEAIVVGLKGEDGAALSPGSSYDAEFLGAIHALLHVETPVHLVDGHLDTWCRALEQPSGHAGLLFGVKDALRIGTACRVARRHSHGHVERADRLSNAALTALGRHS